MTMRREAYDDFHRDFRWEIPEFFNYGTDIVDRMARENDGLALINLDRTGRERRYLYSDIAELSDRLAGGLRAKGLRKGDFVVIMLPRIAEWQIAMIAALKLGAIPIPCIEMLTAADLSYRVRDSGARAVVCRDEQTGKFSGLDDCVDIKVSVGRAAGWDAFDDFVSEPATDFVAAVVSAEDPAIMYYTSGSTGHPKGVLHASRGLYAWWVSACYWLDLGHGDIIWCTADTGWSKAGTSILFGPWARGACTFFYDGPFDPAERLRLLSAYRVNVYCAPATELARVAEQDTGSYDLASLRQTVSAGEAVGSVVNEKWRDATGMPILEAYGQTETLMIVLNYPGERQKPGSMGRTSPGSRVEVIDKSGTVLPDGEEGEIALLTPNPQLMLGYWNQAERTAACFVDGPAGRWYCTGDSGMRDGDGYLWYKGRLDDIISSAGYRIGPTEVENVLLNHPAVVDCAVVGKPDLQRGEIVKAYVVLRKAEQASGEMVALLQAHCKTTTAPYKYPREIEFVSDLPRTATGKIRRSELRNRGRDDVSRV